MTRDTAKPPSDSFLRNAIKRGLQHLITLSLPWTPAPEVLSGTLLAWTNALVDVHGLTDEDAERVATAFQVMAASIEQWPAPATLIKFLPEKPRPYFHKLPSPELTPEEERAECDRRRSIVSREQERLKALLHGQRP